MIKKIAGIGILTLFAAGLITFISLRLEPWWMGIIVVGISILITALFCLALKWLLEG
jgi:predicted membrane channel-forming protein YqfA (hemolysin III family)